MTDKSVKYRTEIQQVSSLSFNSPAQPLLSPNASRKCDLSLP